MALYKEGFGSGSGRGFGYKPRNYGLPAGLQSRASRAPAYYGAGINGLLGGYGQASGGMQTMSLAAETGGSAQGAGFDPTKPPSPSTPPKAAAPKGPSGPPNATGWVDPVLGRTMAFSQRSRDMAQAQARAARKQLAIDYGDASISGDLAGDETTAKAARENPYSILSQLTKHYTEVAPREMDENYNQANLFFSGARAKGRSDLANDHLEQRATADRTARESLSEIDQGLLEALMAADYADMNGMWDSPYPDGGGYPFPGDDYDGSQQGIAGSFDQNMAGIAPDALWEAISAANPGYTREQFDRDYAANQQREAQASQAQSWRGTQNGARPGEVSDLPLVSPYDPNRGTDARYDISKATRQADGTYIGPTGLRYDSSGRRI